jgi:hypothetical protein
MSQLFLKTGKILKNIIENFMLKKIIKPAIAHFLLLTSFCVINIPVKAQTQKAETQKDKCESFKEVNTGKTEIRKQIQKTLLIKDNWNTDFAIPIGKTYNFFVGTMLPENTGNYEVSVRFKYPDNTSDTVYSRNVPMERGETYSLTFRTPTSKQPYQANVLIGGSNNNAYTVSSVGCE